MANGNNESILSGLPWWVKTVAIVGFPVLAAAYLTMLVGQILPNKIDAVLLKTDAIYKLESEHHTMFIEKWAIQDNATKRLIEISLANCINNAGNDKIALNRCLGR